MFHCIRILPRIALAYIICNKSNELATLENSNNLLVPSLNFNRQVSCVDGQRMLHRSRGHLKQFYQFSSLFMCLCMRRCEHVLVYVSVTVCVEIRIYSNLPHVQSNLFHLILNVSIQLCVVVCVHLNLCLCEACVVCLCGFV